MQLSNRDLSGYTLTTADFVSLKRQVVELFKPGNFKDTDDPAAAAAKWTLQTIRLDAIETDGEITGITARKAK